MQERIGNVANSCYIIMNKQTDRQTDKEYVIRELRGSRRYKVDIKHIVVRSKFKPVFVCGAFSIQTFTPILCL